MPVDIMATGFAGLAFEATLGTYVAPTKFFPIRSENLKYVQDEQYRRVIRGIADYAGALPGYSHVEGDIVMEVFDDVLPYFLLASRNTVVKTGAAPFVYTCTPQHGAQVVASAIGKPSLSITVVRDGVPFGYVGMQVSQMTYSVDNGVFLVTLSLQGLDEASQSLPTLSIGATTLPYGAGQYSIEVPTASPVTDTDNFTVTINDNAQPQFRLGSVTKPAYIKFGERTVTASLERDFLTRTEYDAMKALTAQSITVKGTKGANNSVAIKIAASIKNDYVVSGLNGQGNLVRGSVKYTGTYDTVTSKAYEIIVTTAEAIT